jgi:hypothetical protein
MPPLPPTDDELAALLPPAKHGIQPKPGGSAHEQDEAGWEDLAMSVLVQLVADLERGNAEEKRLAWAAVEEVRHP